MKLLWVLLAFLLIANGSLFADETVRESALGPVEVLGSNTDDLDRPQSPVRVDRKKLEAFQYTDVHRALRNTSGVYVREEDGLGLRPNIGLRGTNPDRSKKIVLLEDGVLAGPAPYAAPAAYFSPNVLNIESIEVFKGFSALPYGPNSVGGAIQYLTPPVPMDRRLDINVNAGQFGTRQIKGLWGASQGKWGMRVLGSHLSTDGFKSIDGGGNAGSSQNWLQGLVEHRVTARHTLQLHLGFSEETSNETYLGLSASDFNDRPYRRYAASANDRMRWRHNKMQLRHNWDLGHGVVLETVAYRNNFHRVWQRMDRFADSGVNLREVLNDPTSTRLPYYQVISGQLDSSAIGNGARLIQATNDRSYLSQGVQSKLSFKQAELFVRFHQDHAERLHRGDTFSISDGRLESAGVSSTRDTDNRDVARAFTAYAMNNFNFGLWTITPIVRFESARFILEDRLNNVYRPRYDQVYVPGLSVGRKIGPENNPHSSLRYSINQANSLAGLSSDGDEARESAVNHEVEWRTRAPLYQTELGATWFRNDYRNITGTCTGSGGCDNSQIDRQFNGGKALIEGLELSAAKGFTVSGFYLPVRFNVTLLKAQFKSTFVSTSPEWGSGTVEAGDPLPYVPNTQYTLDLGLEKGRLRSDVVFTYQSAVADQAVALNRIVVPAFGVIDTSTSWKINRNNKISLRVDNLLARNYAVAARPFGLRPGKPQTVMLNWAFQY